MPHQYLEDIIGTSRYKEEIDKALASMEELSEQRGERLNRLRHVEKEKQSLEVSPFHLFRTY